jgi:hypothetical protein
VLPIRARRLATAMLVVLLSAVAGCHVGARARCPTPTMQVEAIRLTGRAVSDLARTASAPQLLARAEPLAAPPYQALDPNDGNGPMQQVDEVAAVRAFAAATDFARSDVMLVPVGGDRQRLVGLFAEGDGEFVLRFTADCPPCAGGDPGSYYAAAGAVGASRRPGTMAVTVPKGAPITVKLCGMRSCGGCPRNVP